MVSCRSCGRFIASGTSIRCTKCCTPFHLSCSHRYKISSEGVFNVCCGQEADSVFPGSSAGCQMRTRQQIKRRQPQDNSSDNNGNSSLLGNNQLDNNSEESNESMRYGKVQKVDPASSSMGVQQKPVAQNKPSDCLEINQQDFTEDNFDNDIDARSTDSVTILDEEVNNTQTSIYTINESQIKTSITLETVWDGISSLQSSISNISNSLDTVSTHLNTIDPRISELETSIKAIKDKTSNLENVHGDMNGLKDELKHITSDLEKLKASQQEKNIDMGDVLCEMKEREMKSKNIIIYNVSEDHLRLSQNYSTLQDIDNFNYMVEARDASRARDILRIIPNVNLNEIQTRRLGRARPNSCRPLRVTLPDKSDVITIMKNKSLVNQQYTVKTDLTKLQQRKIKMLKEELERINVDKQIMTIKFINGEPQLIPVGQNYFKRE